MINQQAAAVSAVLLMIFSATSLCAGPLEQELREAVRSRNIPRIRELVVAGADINASDSSGKTPILIAIDNGYSDIVRYLLKVGAGYPEKTGLYADAEVVRNSCWVNCRKIETAILMHNQLAVYCEVILLEYDLERDEFVETEITESILERFLKFLPEQRMPGCQSGGEYVMYPKRKSYTATTSLPDIGVYCTVHGLPQMGVESFRSVRPTNPDLLIEKFVLH
ncbi:MAG: ankyrin repeat domain-containing protein [Candidatus Wallbacteria bacterium]|nr:ankyrin repeat domain-containing protein [Candidatus Wallbacteria bacterium]